MKGKGVFITVLALLSGCAVSPKTSIQGMGGRVAYNQVIQESTAEQMLLNIVRMRYADMPFFLDVTGVTSQYTMKSQANATIKIPGFSDNNPSSVGGNFSWQSQPTIQYAPLEGRAFARQLMEPIDLHLIQQLVFTGWDVSRLFRLAVQVFDDIPNAIRAAAPSVDTGVIEYERFNEATALMRKLQLAQKLQMGVKDNMLQITFKNDTRDAEQLARLLKNAKKYKNRYMLSLDVGFNEEAEIGILPRSLIGCMYYLSLGVHVPWDDIQNGVANIPRDDMDDFNKLQTMMEQVMNIQCSYSQPCSAYVWTKYHGVYFYIGNNDLSSKKTFALLLQLYNLQAKESNQPSPILSIPLG